MYSNNELVAKETILKLLFKIVFFGGSKSKRDSNREKTQIQSNIRNDTYTKLVMLNIAKKNTRKYSFSKIVSECKKRDDQLSRREVARNYLYRTSHQDY